MTCSVDLGKVVAGWTAPVMTVSIDFAALAEFSTASGSTGLERLFPNKPFVANAKSRNAN